MRRRTWGFLGAGAAAAAVGVAAAASWSGGGARTVEPRARAYRDVSVCLLTDGRGVSDPPAASVWAGMEDASSATHVMVSSLAVAGPGTAANAVAYANTLVQQRCAVVLAVGAAQTSAVDQMAARAPKVRFVLVGGGTPKANVTVLAASGDPRSVVAQTVRNAVSG